jgi:hypothetical protein
MFITTCAHTASFDSLRTACRHAAEAKQRRCPAAPVATAHGVAARLCALLASCLTSGVLLGGIVLGMTSVAPVDDMALVGPSAANDDVLAGKTASCPDGSALSQTA